MLYGPSNNKNYQNRFPESTFHHFWGQAMKMLKICFQKLLLTISGASHGKCLKSTSGGYFWPYLVPSSENAQNQLPEATFNNIRGQATKMLKIDYWSVHWTISWNLLPSTWKMIPGACYQALWKLSLLPSTWNRILLAGTAKYSMVHLSTFPPSTFPPFQLFTFLPFYLPPFHLFPFPPFHLPLCLRNVFTDYCIRIALSFAKWL